MLRNEKEPVRKGRTEEGKNEGREGGRNRRRVRSRRLRGEADSGNQWLLHPEIMAMIGTSPRTSDTVQGRSAGSDQLCWKTGFRKRLLEEMIPKLNLKDG